VHDGVFFTMVDIATSPCLAGLFSYEVVRHRAKEIGDEPPALLRLGVNLIRLQWAM
jgi:hypothetical protein